MYDLYYWSDDGQVVFLGERLCFRCASDRLDYLSHFEALAGMAEVDQAGVCDKCGAEVGNDGKESQ